MDCFIENENEDIKVSVFCLAYNHEKYIKKTLEGFVMQRTSFQYEVFVHDDASNDNTPNIIKEYAEKYPSLIKPIFQKENQMSKGVGIGHTYIFPKMKGKYIASCEGDDYWNDEYKLQKQFEFMEAHSECSLSTHRAQCCNEDGTYNDKVIPDKRYRLDKSGIISEKELVECYWVRGTYPFHTSSYFYRKSVIDTDLKYSRDIGILRKCLLKGSVYYINETMSVRRLGSTDGWTTHLEDKGSSGWFELALRDNEEEDRFDQYTNYKYHDFIQVGRLKKFVSYSRWIEYHKEIKELLAKYNLSPWKVRKKIPINMFLELQLKYMLAIYFPKCYIGIRKIWNMLVKNNKK